MPPPTIFCNVAWMEYYDGRKGDSPCNGGKYVVENGYGAELYNFKRHRNKVYGFVAAHNSTINICRLGANVSDESVSGVRVFWAATPEEGGRRLVGWYDDATVYRTFKNRPSAPAFPKKNMPYIIAADAGNEHLIPISLRKCPQFLIPNARDAGKNGIQWGMGQNPIRYVENSAGQKLVDSIIKELGIEPPPHRKTSGQQKLEVPRGGWNSDPIERQEIEQAAMNAVAEHFGRHAWKLEDVSKHGGLGYDFKASRSGESDLHLEVKGCKGNLASFELTPSEYRHVKEFRDDYRICVLTSALKPSRHLQIFRYHPGTKQWQDENGGTLAIEEKMGAHCLLQRRVNPQSNSSFCGI